MEMPQIGNLQNLMSDFSFGFSNSDERFGQGSSSIGQHSFALNSLIYQSGASANTGQRFSASGNQPSTSLKGTDQMIALFQSKASTGIDQSLPAAPGAHSSQPARSSAFSDTNPQASSQPSASAVLLASSYAPAAPIAADQQQLQQLFSSMKPQHSGNDGGGTATASPPQPLAASATPRTKPVAPSGGAFQGQQQQAELLASQFAALGLVEPPRSAPSAPPLPHHASPLMQPERTPPVRPATAAGPGAADQLHTYNPNEFFVCN